LQRQRAPGIGATYTRKTGARVAPPLRRADPSVTWRLGQPKCHVAQGQHKRQVFASHCYYNIITYNKNINIYTTTDNIFSIHTINYKKNNIYNTNNTIFYINILNFSKNNNIFNAITIHYNKIIIFGTPIILFLRVILLIIRKIIIFITQIILFLLLIL
jgi:hypothetical protein